MSELGRPDSSSQPRILLRSSWQSVNIGDIAHTPGALHALEQFAGHAEVTLWGRGLGADDRAMIEREFPRVQIVDGRLDADGRPTSDALSEAWNNSDLLLHGSGPSMVAESEMFAWHKTERPYGFFGVTVDPVSNPKWGTLAELGSMIDALPTVDLDVSRRELIDGASFMYCRDTLSLRYLQAQGVECPVLDFGPDATFVFDHRDEASGDAVMNQLGLRDGEFMVVIPRLRYTPYYRIRNTVPTIEDLRRDRVNAATRASDMGKLRDFVIGWVRATGMDVLACPEMTYEVELAREELCEGLPADVAGKVKHLPDYWMPDTASAVYARSHAMVSYECHSPIMGVVHGIPSLYVREPTDTIKGQMWSDVGLSGSIAEVDEVSGESLVNHMLAWRENRSDAESEFQAARTLANGKIQSMVDTVIKAVG